MSKYNYFTHSLLITGLLMLMLHLVYSHAQILDSLNPDSHSFLRSVLFSVAYSFMTIIVIALLQNEVANRWFAVADAVAVFIYYASPIYTNFDFLILVKSLFYSGLTGINTYMLGSLSLKYFSQIKEVVNAEIESLKQKLDSLKIAFEESEKAKVSFIKEVDSLRKEALRQSNLNDTLRLELEQMKLFKADALKWRLANARKKKDNDFEVDVLQKQLNEIEK